MAKYQCRLLQFLYRNINFSDFFKPNTRLVVWTQKTCNSQV